MSAATTREPTEISPPTSAAQNSRRAAWLAWLSLFISFVLAAASAFYLYRNRAGGIESNDYWAANAAIAMIYPMVGALIISRRPRHVIGWLFCLTGILNAIVVFGSEYAAFGLASGHETLPGALLLAWLDHWLWVPAAVPVILLIQLFPEGRTLSARWATAIWATLVGTVLLSVSVAFISGPLTIANIDNPYALANADDLLNVLALAGGVLLVAAIMASLASLVIKGRRAQGSEREQLKWFVYAGIVSIALFFAGVIADQVSNRTFFSPLANSFAFPLLPAAVGIAILRYRLYEIDLLINRTLVYVPLSAILAGVFAASITLSQKVFVAISGTSSDAATVLTTLIVVAAFEPLKKWLQDKVDKRFKSTHDPETQLKPFADLLRARVFAIDPAALAHRLAWETMSTFAAEGVHVELGAPPGQSVDYTVGKWHYPPALLIPLRGTRAQMGTLELGPRLNGEDYTTRDRAALTELASVVAEACENNQVSG